MAKTKEKRRGLSLGQTAAATLKNAGAETIADGFSINVNGLVVHGQPELSSSTRVANKLRVAERSIQFAIGDLYNFCEEAYGEEAAQIFDHDEGWSYKTLQVYAWLAKRIPREIRRMDRLGIKHHLLVAPLTHAQQERWLKKAAADDTDEPWTAARLKKAMEEGDDMPVSAWWVLVAAQNPEDQTALMAAMEGQGRSVKAVVKRKRKE